MKPLDLVINRNDRRDALLGMGVSPGQDESYDEQAKRLMAQKSVIARDRRNVLERLEAMIQTNRSKRSPEGTWSPSEFAIETLAKTIPTPSEANPANIIKSIPELAKGAVEVAKHPLATLKQLALNPPEATTVASMMLPGAALKAYRELTPLAARTYIHHMAGIPTPFSHVTEAERKALTEMAQDRIHKLLSAQTVIDRDKSHALRSINELRLMNKAELLDYLEVDNDIPRSLFTNKNGTYKDVKDIRELAVEHYKRQRPSIFNISPDDRRYQLSLGDEADNANVREDFKKLTGEQLKAFQIYPSGKHDFTSAFGKTYVEPMIDKATGKIVPKAIKDTYKFYPDVYGFHEGEGREALKAQILSGLQELKEPSLLYSGQPFSKLKDIRDRLESIFSPNRDSFMGIASRKLGMKRPTSIIDIPLTQPPPMNAYDKAAILLGAQQLAKEKRK